MRFKVCAGCSEMYTHDCFHRLGDGWQRKCKRCRSRTSAKKYARWALFTPRELELQRKRADNRKRRSDPVRLAAERAAARTPEALAAAARRSQNRRRQAGDAIRAKRRAYRASRREIERAQQRRANDRRRFGRDADSRTYAELLRRDLCAYCGSESQHVDHIQPTIAGGVNGWENLTSACAPCNLSKAGGSLLGFLLRRAA